MRILVTLILPLFLISCSTGDLSLSHSLPIIPECPELLETDPEDFFSTGESRLLRSYLKPNYLIMEVGASSGSWTKHALITEPHLQLIAFEPIPEVFARLKKEVGKKATSIHNLALSDRIGKSRFFFYNDNWKMSRVSGFFKQNREIKKGKEPVTITVEQDTLDHFCFNQDIESIDLLKIDAEGSEMKVLVGAESLLKEHKIRAIEFTHSSSCTMTGFSLKELIYYLSSYDYVLFRITPKGLIHITKWIEPLENIPRANYFAVRRSEIPEYSPTEEIPVEISLLSKKSPYH